jgi:uncharacterized protein (TIGR02996 family)
MAKRKAKPGAANTPQADEAGFIASIEADPNDTTARAAYADWLDEHDRPIEAAEQRDAAGLTEVQYKLRRKSDGLFAEAREHSPRWSSKGKVWRRLKDLRTHLTAVRAVHRTYEGYGSGTPWSDLEVVVVEVRPVTLACWPLVFRKPGQGRDVPLITFAKSAGSGST